MLVQVQVYTCLLNCSVKHKYAQSVLCTVISLNDFALKSSKACLLTSKLKVVRSSNLAADSSYEVTKLYQKI